MMYYWVTTNVCVLVGLMWAKQRGENMVVAGLLAFNFQVIYLLVKFFLINSQGKKDGQETK